MIRVHRFLAVASIACAAPLRAQGTPPTPPTPADIPAARPADVATIDGIIGALYESISGPAGAPREWDRFRSLFAPGGRLIPTQRRTDSTWTSSTLSPDEYVARSDAGLRANGFFEKEVARKTDRFGNIVQMFSTYESRRFPLDERPFARGINSIQLRHDGARWWIVTVFWEAESAAHPLPAEYWPGGRGGGARQ